MCKVTEFALLGASRATFMARAEQKGWSTERAERAWDWITHRSFNAV